MDRKKDLLHNSMILLPTHQQQICPHLILADAFMSPIFYQWGHIGLSYSIVYPHNWDLLQAL